MSDTIEILAAQVAFGNRRALAKAITLIESRRAADRTKAESLLAALPKPETPALRLGLSGTPGVGKSTFIEALGLMLVEAGHKVAVLAVDPSSARSGGSILGDKTRMEQLSRSPQAFIRPSPAQTQLGGVARRTREAIRLVEAAGHDIVLVETVGVGQSETLVAEMTDIFVLLLAPAAGDELQGVKRGIMEMADVLLVNKADGALKPQAESTRADYAGALGLMRPRPDDPKGYPAARTLSAQTGEGLSEAWDTIMTLATARLSSGALIARRAEQNRTWFREELTGQFLDHVQNLPAMKSAISDIEASVVSGALPPSAAARKVIESVFGETG
ncbi:methylmalonyl Co-A mutase-associated GTPase MeaB [Oceanibium sediminis]|uniref:methylmalonyl Co-A mutase-associated GTPase MeaB n=1 Tax=Oceanibium sediminis TaxID=2026339 RepID=UPI001E38D487|nr:methylmalonyl Co-A mutase-associated GTPase MeaB [Oceanibium sediminis]